VFHADVPRRVSNYVGEQLGMLLERTRLGKDRSRLEAELAALREDLATRKAVQRAQGILVTRRGMTPASARLWISQQARRARLTRQQLAEQVVAGENAQRQNLFTPWRHRRIA
jgi:AmiR/NasT family two-component response regulator